MGVIEFLILIVVVVFLGWLAIFAMGKLAPGHPPYLDNVVWFVVVVVILVTLAQAMNLLSHDPQIPRVR